MPLQELKITRDPAAYTEWWANVEQNTRASIKGCVELIREADDAASTYLLDDSNVEDALHTLALELFQGAPSGTGWLRVSGLRPDFPVRYLSLDFDIAYDGDGVRDGVLVVFSLMSEGLPGAILDVRVYVERAKQMFTPTPGTTDPAAAVAEIIDTALELINKEIADRDRFNTQVRAHA